MAGTPIPKSKIASGETGLPWPFDDKKQKTHAMHIAIFGMLCYVINCEFVEFVHFVHR